MKKKTGLIVIAVVLVLVIAVVGGVISTYNGLVEDREAVLTAQSTVETYLQRRADLIPNLVSTVKGYAAHEEEVYTALAVVEPEGDVDALDLLDVVLIGERLR